jgi:hypothetical protein
MKLCVLKFALPFNLALPDGTSFTFPESGQTVMIRVHRKRGARIFSYELDNRDWLNERLQITAPLDDVPGRPGGLAYGYTLNAPQTDFSGGVLETIEYTVLDFRFESDDADFLAKADHYVEWATPIVRRFVDNCRVSTNKAWLGEFGDKTYAEVVLLGCADSAGLGADPLSEFQFIQLSRMMPPFLNGLVPTVAGDRVAEIDQRMRSGSAASLPESILMEGITLATRHQKFDLAIILIETAFEVFVQQLLLEYCNQNNVPTLDLRSKIIPYQAAIEGGNIEGDLFRHINRFKSVTIKATQECKNWRNDVYDKRIAIVHRGSRGATELDVKKAVASAQAFMQYLKSLFL